MRRVILLVAVIAFLFCAVISLVTLRTTKAQINQKPDPAAMPLPNQGAVIGGPNATLPARSPELQCQGCHGPGKQLPYLAGSLFHNEPHNGYDHSFHAQAKQNGARGAACLDCHTKNGDMTTILPPSDPKS